MPQIIRVTESDFTALSGGALPDFDLLEIELLGAAFTPLRACGVMPYQGGDLNPLSLVPPFDHEWDIEFTDPGTTHAAILPTLQAHTAVMPQSSISLHRAASLSVTTTLPQPLDVDTPDFDFRPDFFTWTANNPITLLRTQLHRITAFCLTQHAGGFSATPRLTILKNGSPILTKFGGTTVSAFTPNGMAFAGGPVLLDASDTIQLAIERISGSGNFDVVSNSTNLIIR